MGADDTWSIGLPDYERPPVVEVAVGIEFLPLPGLGVVNLVHLHDLWRTDFPQIYEQPPLPPSSGFGGQSGLQFRMSSGVPPIRIWMLSPSGNELIQVQNDRLVLNWRKLSLENDEYPRYRTLRTRYHEVWSKFENRVRELGAGSLEPSVADVTFVNRIELGETEGISAALACFSGDWISGHPEGASSFQSNFPILDDELNAMVGSQMVNANYDPAGSFVQLEIATNFSISDSSAESVVGSLDLAHAAGVKAFDRITTEQLHERWGKK